MKLTPWQILQHLQSQATEKMENLTTSMQRDSTTVRIIGTMTFLYLPGTFVSVSMLKLDKTRPRAKGFTDVLQH